MVKLSTYLAFLMTCFIAVVFIAAASKQSMEDSSKPSAAKTSSKPDASSLPDCKWRGGSEFPLCSPSCGACVPAGESLNIGGCAIRTEGPPVFACVTKCSDCPP